MNLNKDISVVQISTGEDEEAETDPAQRQDPLCVDAFSGLSIPETISSNDSFDPVSFFEPNTEKHSFLLSGKMDLSLNQEDFPSQIFSFSGAATSDCLQEERLLQVQRAYEQHYQEEPEESFREDLLCAQAETLHHLQTDVQLDKPRAGGSWALNPADPLIINIKTSSSSSDTPHVSASLMQVKMEDISVQSTAGSWWKHNLESHQVPSSQKLPVTEAGADSPKRSSVGSGQPYSYSLFTFTEKHKGDDREGKQADKEYAAGWSSLGKDSQGAIRTRSRKGKRVKRT
ncbi:uncharacterized protein LOC115413524 [Sphaeramia orbicularis]|uniref:uncharacterized protein LOC115413524 n=1 Tax=Sphaeramia orbicularis TaxID=375764 RepID=UPI0011802AC1|nr:uncharacterized protein LOC115413524 [Sphaeramia orbicularis]